MVLVLILLEVSEVGLEGLVHLDLDKLLQALVLSGLQVDVGLLGDQKLVAGKLLLVQLKLLLESRKLVDLSSLGVLELTDDLGALVLLLGDGELEVLALGLEHLSKLGLFVFQLFDLLFHFFEFSVEFRLLGSHFTEKCAIELADVVVATPSIASHWLAW